MEPETIAGIENECYLSIRSLGTLSPLIANFIVVLVSHLSRIMPTATSQDQRRRGCFLAQGNLVYLESPAPFVENASAECRTPRDLVAYQRAGERLILKVIPAAALQTKINANDVELNRIVTDYSGKAYCGAHLNIGARTEPKLLLSCLLPFIVTTPWTKSGGIGSNGFVLSQKAQAIRTAMSDDTRGEQRPIISTRNRANGETMQRLHLSSIDATMSPQSLYLLAGSLMILVKMLDDGACVGPAMSLLDPVETFRNMDTDILGRRPVQLKCGVEVRPVDIQRYFLELAEKYVVQQSPSWMHEFIEDWRKHLDMFEHDPSALATKIDPFIKMRLFSRIIRNHRFDYNEFRAWCAAINLIKDHVDGANVSEMRSREFYRERLPFVPFHLLDEQIARRQLSWPRLPDALNLWWTLQATDIDYHSIKEDGLFWRLSREGLIDAGPVDEEAIERAMVEPPRNTRAYARGHAIRELAASGPLVGHWNGVKGPKNFVTLPDPLSSAFKVVQKQPNPKKEVV